MNDAARRKRIKAGFVVVHRQAQLLEIVATLRASGRFARLLHSRKEQRHQDRNNGNDDEQLDESKTPATYPALHDVPPNAIFSSPSFYRLLTTTQSSP